ncbi:MAG: sulfatase [Fimbriimonadaceae bacterium]|nr:sulfatase [Fimbriimonadaceae bacterium]
MTERGQDPFSAAPHAGAKKGPDPFSRREVLRLGALAAGAVATRGMRAARRPDVLLIAIDDQNSWLGHLGVHPSARTPHLDALAGRGTTFTNAHCQAPLCNPSRTSLMTGLRPSSSGIYGLAPWFRTVPELRQRVTLPQAFAAAGYRTAATGKVYHGGQARQASDPPEFAVWGPPGGLGARPPSKLIPPTPMGNHPAMDWGCFPHRDEDKGDYQITDWAIRQLLDAPPDQPQFLAVGYYLPHVPCYATQRWFDLYPDDDRLLPPVRRDDRRDTPDFSWYLHWDLPEPRLRWLEESGQWRHLVRSYLACTSFVDAQIGRLLAGLQASGRADDTIVVVCGDNGFHLGEKLISGKNTLWDEGTRVPLIFAGPGVSRRGRCRQPAELLDVFPTLLELCDLPPRPDQEGRSLLPQLRLASTPRRQPAITTHNQGNHGIRSERYRYIQYADGSAEFYDCHSDPHQWTNLIADSRYADLIAAHRRWLPHPDRPPAPGSAERVLTYDADSDTATWENRTTIHRGDRAP